MIGKLVQYNPTQILIGEKLYDNQFCDLNDINPKLIHLSTLENVVSKLSDNVLEYHPLR
jgi:hypothetical protein